MVGKGIKGCTYKGNEGRQVIKGQVGSSSPGKGQPRGGVFPTKFKGGKGQ